jgi:mutator protein MutT
MAAAAAREAKEETGLDVEVIRHMLTYDHLIPKEQQHWVTTMFVGKVKPGQEPRVMEPDKCDEIGWFALDELPYPLSIATELKLNAYRREGNDDMFKAAGIIIKDRKTLAVKSKGKPVYVQPGGKLEPGETAKEALVRELQEELMIDTDEDDFEYLGTFSADAANEPGRKIHMQVFIVKKWRGEIKLANEIEKMLWFNSGIPKDVEIGSIFIHDIIPRLKEQDLID